MDYLLKMGIITHGRTIPPVNPSPFQPTSNNVFQVRIMPDMANIWDIEDSSGYYKLPWYPNFFADSHNAYREGDLVWLFIDDDYHVGFIIGYAQSAGGHDISSLAAIIGQAEVSAGYKQSGIDELTIQKLDEKSITAINRNNGRVIQVYNNRTVYIFGEDGSMYGTNKTSFQVRISATGDISYTGASKKEDYTGDVSINGNNYSESFHTIKSDSVSGMKLHAGGSFSATSGGNMTHSSIGTQTNTAFGMVNTSATGISNTVGLGTFNNTVIVGAYTITAIGGVVNIASAITVSIEAPFINLIGLVNIVGALNLVEAPFVFLPYNPVIGFEAGASVASAPVPLIVGI